MASVKFWFQRLRPLRLYIVLILTAAYFLTQLFVSHLTHALTLLVDSYHVLCNLIALVGCIITIKYGRPVGCEKPEDSPRESSTEELRILSVPLGSGQYASQNCAQPERELRNTFGWARIDVLVMLIGGVFLASLCFSLLVEALQTLVHISHLDEMHHPIPVLYVGLTGLFLNLICYLLIGGYTYHQGSFLHVTAEGDVVLESVTENSVSNGQRRLSSQTRRVHVPLQPPKRQGLWETCRDIIGCLFVILCAVIVFFTSQQDVAKYIDPILSIISAILLLIFSYPYMKESCLILLQTIPDHINMDSLITELLSTFPGIVNVHDFHVWQLTVNKTVSTVHIIFLNPQVYSRITDDIKKFFEVHGISHVTVQPEFFKDMNSVELVSGYGAAQCLVQCLGEDCIDCQCCSSDIFDLKSVTISNNSPNNVNGKEINTKKPVCSSHSLPQLPPSSVLDRNSAVRSSCDNTTSQSVISKCQSTNAINDNSNVMEKLKSSFTSISIDNIVSESCVNNNDASNKSAADESSSEEVKKDSDDCVYVDNVLVINECKSEEVEPMNVEVCEIVDSESVVKTINDSIVSGVDVTNDSKPSDETEHVTECGSTKHKVDVKETVIEKDTQRVKQLEAEKTVSDT